MADTNYADLVQAEATRDEKRRGEVAALYARLLPWIKAIARRRLTPQIRRRADEDDVTQETLIHVQKRLRSGDFEYRSREEFFGWIKRIVANRIRSIGGRMSVAALGSSHVPDRGRIERSDLHIDIQSSLSQLPENMRKAFLLRHSEGLGFDAIADRLDVATTTAWRWVTDAERLFREHLGNVN